MTSQPTFSSTILVVSNLNYVRKKFRGNQINIESQKEGEVIILDSRQLSKANSGAPGRCVATEHGTCEPCVWARDHGSFTAVLPPGPRGITSCLQLSLSAPAHQPCGRLPHPEDASDRPYCPPDHSGAAQ